MTTSRWQSAASRRLSLQQKLALAGGAGVAVAGAAVAPSAEAGIVQSPTLPLSPPVVDPGDAGSTLWDVDGPGGPFFGGFLLDNASDRSALLNEVGAARFVAPNHVPGDGFAKLTAGFTVGPTMAGYKFFSFPETNIQITDSAAAGDALAPNGWTLGNVGYFGFKFTDSSGVHYGWGEINIHGATGGFGPGRGFTFTRAYYNDTPGAAIQVGVVPEPALAGPAGVCALVMGSLAMLERRRRRKGDAADATAV